MVDGIININKPRDRTSFSIVSMVKRMTKEQRVGHAGTLDPAATGILPVCLGRGTRIIEFLVDATKTYQAEIELGMATDTYDASGQITQRGDPSGISQDQLESVLTSFCGLILQIPPMYSAVKYQGKPLYKLARAGITVERRSRLAKIHSLELVDWQPPIATIEVVCGKGTYIRALAHDLGQTLGCGACLKSLVRSRCGRFNLGNAVSVPQLEDAFRHGYWQHFVYPIDSVLAHWTTMVVSDTAEQSIRNGRPLVLGDTNGNKGNKYHEQHITVEPSSENHCRAYALDGHFLGVLRFNSERRQWQPEKVFL
ncbi:tRNA pseudouridine(55) synthase TruB [Chloroflexota bacterium]